MTDYDTAKWYDVFDSETLEHETPGEALDEYFDSWMERDCDVEAVIRERAPVTVRAYVPETLPGDYAEAIAMQVAGDHDEEHGNPNGGGMSAVADTDWQRYVEAMRAAVAVLLEIMPVYICKEVGKREYSADECVAMMREERPDWF